MIVEATSGLVATIGRADLANYSGFYSHVSIFLSNVLDTLILAPAPFASSSFKDASSDGIHIVGSLVTHTPSGGSSG